jgi:hypothetical protein
VCLSAPANATLNSQVVRSAKRRLPCLSSHGKRPRTSGKAERYLVCVSVVVVVVGPGTVVCCDDVVVLLCVASEAQPQINVRAVAVRQEMIIFFISED